MKILLLGSTGLAGSAINRYLNTLGIDTIGVARKKANINIDLTDEVALSDLLISVDHDAVINAAALVDIKECEINPLEGWKINSSIVSVLAKWSNEENIPLLHISTDHYYPYGNKNAHKENDRIFLLNNYAKQKYAAEAFALTSKNALVLRTSIIGWGTKDRQTLIDWAYKSLVEGKVINLFSDSYTSSLDVNSFAYYCVELFIMKKYRGILNLASSEVYSKEDLIRKLANRFSLSHDQCISASIKDNLSNRPNCLGLDVSKVENILNKSMPSLSEILDKLVKDKNENY